MSAFKKISYWYQRLVYVLGDDIGYFAASLSFYTIFAVIPIIWILFFVLSQFEAFSIYYANIKNFIVMNFVPTHTAQISQYLDAFLNNADRMGVSGVVYIAVASVLFYNNYQYIVNKIFSAPNNSFWRALKIYLIFFIMLPLTLGLSFYLSDYLQRIVGEQNSVFGVYSVLSYMLVWLLVFVLFKVSPNVAIGFRVAMISSFVVSLFWQLAKSLFVYYVVINQAYSSLYGSFGVILFLLLWIYLSWFMLLYGLRLCYLLQNHREIF